MRDLIPITQKQTDILLLIYKFRFLTTNHIQTILKHKNPHRIQAWLKDLTDKKYVQRHYSRKNFSDGSKPAIYYLATLSKHILKDKQNVSEVELIKVYKEGKRSQRFINHCLSLADIFVFFLAQTKSEEELHFFTKNTLNNYDFILEELIDGYIALKSKSGTKRYLLTLFDEVTPPFIMRKRIKEYIAYSDSGIWEEKTNSDLPPIFLVFPNNKTQAHIFWYSKSLLDKTFNDKLTFCLTTKDKLNITQATSTIWQIVK